MSRATRALGSVSRGAAFAAPEIEVLDLPGWDCQPYDRVSPNAAIAARRMTVLARLARSRTRPSGRAYRSTTVDAILQRVPPLRRVAADTFSAAPGNAVKMDLPDAMAGDQRLPALQPVREPGEYALRGGILDLFAPSMAAPIRLDFFGDTLESIRAFDPETQRTVGQLRALDLVPMSEVQLTSAKPCAASARPIRALWRRDARRRALRDNQRGPPPSRRRTLAAAVLRQARHAVRLFRRRAAAARPASRGRRERAAGADRGLLRGAQERL